MNSPLAGGFHKTIGDDCFAAIRYIFLQFFHNFRIVGRGPGQKNDRRFFREIRCANDRETDHAKEILNIVLALAVVRQVTVDTNRISCIIQCFVQLIQLETKVSRSLTAQQTKPEQKMPWPITACL